MKTTEDYLIARVGALRLGIFCKDVLNVHSDSIRLVRLFYQGRIFRGIASINGQITQVIDLRMRIGIAEPNHSERLMAISFQTGVVQRFAVIVDEILGMKSIGADAMQKTDSRLSSRTDNIHLLFPAVAMLGQNELIHLMDATYLEKLEPIVEEAGELELF